MIHRRLSRVSRAFRLLVGLEIALTGGSAHARIRVNLWRRNWSVLVVGTKNVEMGEMLMRIHGVLSHQGVLGDENRAEFPRLRSWDWRACEWRPEGARGVVKLYSPTGQAGSAGRAMFAPVGK